MRIETLRVKNFKCFRDVEIKNIPRFCVLVGANGTGKSTLFNMFGFLKEAFSTNVHTALLKLGGAKGFQEVVTRNTDEPIQIELQFRVKDDAPLITYILQISDSDQGPVVSREILRYRRGRYGLPWHFLDFKNGQGYAVTNEFLEVKDIAELNRQEHNLKSADVLAIKGLSQFKNFPAVVELGNLIENWHVSDFQISRARPEQDVGYAEHLSREGENLSLVLQFLHRRHPQLLDKILLKLSRRVPGIASIETKTTEEGKVLLRFQDRSFAEPFLARYVSDGTIKMLAYLVLLHDPKVYPLLCVEEPENQLYPSLMPELAEEFRDYAKRGGQVFVSTHSPDFLNAVLLEEVFWLVKENGCTLVKRALEDPQVKAYMEDRDLMGVLWKQGFFTGADP